MYHQQTMLARPFTACNLPPAVSASYWESVVTLTKLWLMCTAHALQLRLQVVSCIILTASLCHIRMSDHQHLF